MNWSLISLTEETRLARIAAACILKLAKPDLPVDVLAMLQRCRGTTVMTAARLREMDMEMPESVWKGLSKCGALTYCIDVEQWGERRYIVLYRDDLPPEERRWNLAHEFGHRTLGHMFSDTEEIVHPAGEAAADLFAGHLLVPQPVLYRLVRSSGEAAAARMVGAPEKMVRKLLKREKICLGSETEKALCELLIGGFETKAGKMTDKQCE